MRWIITAVIMATIVVVCAYFGSNAAQWESAKALSERLAEASGALDSGQLAEAQSQLPDIRAHLSKPNSPFWTSANRSFWHELQHQYAEVEQRARAENARRCNCKSRINQHIDALVRAWREALTDSFHEEIASMQHDVSGKAEAERQLMAAFSKLGEALARRDEFECDVDSRDIQLVAKSLEGPDWDECVHKLTEGVAAGWPADGRMSATSRKKIRSIFAASIRDSIDGSPTISGQPILWDFQNPEVEFQRDFLLVPSRPPSVSSGDGITVVCVTQVAWVDAGVYVEGGGYPNGVPLEMAHLYEKAQRQEMRVVVVHWPIKEKAVATTILGSEPPKRNAFGTRGAPINLADWIEAQRR